MHVVIAQIESKTINKVSAEAYFSHAAPSLGLSLVFAQKEAGIDIKLWIYASVCNFVADRRQCGMGSIALTASPGR